MSKYTTEVRYICENLSGLSESVDGTGVEEVISSARPHIFDFAYPIFDETYRAGLEQKILRHFYTREIGLESYGLWKMKLRTMMFEIMPYYNQLYESTLIELDPLKNVNYTREGSESSSESQSADTSLSSSETGSEQGSSSERNSLAITDTTWDLHQDTPQNGLAGIEAMEYLTTADKRTYVDDNQTYINRNQSATDTRQAATDTSSQAQKDNAREYLERYVGYRGSSPSKLLLEYRDTFLNIDMMIIKNLEQLFMQLW